MKYRSLIVRKHGGPEVLEVVENELRPCRKGEMHIHVLAASVCRPDVTARRGEALYSGIIVSWARARVSASSPTANASSRRPVSNKSFAR